MRPPVRAVLDRLLQASEPGGRVSLNTIAEEFGTSAINQADIELLFDALEAAGREVWAPPGGGTPRLAEVLRAARALRQQTGQTPSAAAIAAAIGRPVDEVYQALLLGKILGK